MQIKPKAGRNGTGSYGVEPPAGAVFGKVAPSPSPRNINVFGDSLGSRAQFKGSTMVDPLAGFFNTGTEAEVIALTTDKTGNNIGLMPPNQANNTVAPYERGTVLQPVASIAGARVAYGAAPTAEKRTPEGLANTAFRPNPRNRPKTKPAKPQNAVSIKRSFPASFLNSAGTLMGHAPADKSTPRWGVVKRGVV